MMGEVIVLAPGLYTTIQDKGRFGFSKYGVPKSGAMDQRSLLLANALLNNDENCSVFEWVLQPPKLRFSASTSIVCTGAICDPVLNKSFVKLNTPIFVNEGDILEFKNIRNGCYGYIGIKNGFCSEFIMGSRSFYKNITKQYILKKADTIAYNSMHRIHYPRSTIKIEAFWEGISCIDVYPGAEFDQLSNVKKEELWHSEFKISGVRSRMGIQLQERLVNSLPSILSSPVLPGTVQLTPGGKIIVLMRDCQTTGGYPRILQLTKEAINCIAQKNTGEAIKFCLKDF